MSTPLPNLDSAGRSALDSLLASTVARRHVPAVFYLATNARETIYSNQKGEVVFDDPSSGEVTEDTTLELFSQTKFITALACLQIVDNGLVSLDSEEDVERYLPEIKTLPVLKGYDEQGKAILGEAQNKVTLRQLLSHTAGFVYMHSDSILSPYLKTNPAISIFDPSATIKTLCQPLIYEPGTSWAYSTSIDWAGKLVERATGERLDAYFVKNIFDPVGAESLTFFPDDKVKANKMAMTVRGPDGKPHVTPDHFGMGRPNVPEKVSTELLLGGAGLFGKLKDYLAVLRAVLQCDPNAPEGAASSGKRLISEKAYAELWKGNVTEEGRTQIAIMAGRPAYFDPPATPENLDHSVGFLLNLEDFNGRRKAGSGCWSGAAKTQFWIDPKTGLAGICGTQLLSNAPDPWFASYCDYERELYKHLK